MMKLSFPLFALSLLHGQGVSHSKDLKPSSLRKAEVVGDVEKQGQDLSLLLQSKAIAAEAVHTFVDISHSNARHLTGTTSWAQVGLDINGIGEDPFGLAFGFVGDELGWSVALSSDGMILAVGAIVNSGNGANSFGHVKVFKWNNDAWIQLGDDIDGEAAGDRSGASVALSGDGMIVAIGAFGNDANGPQSGHTRVHQWNTTTWIQVGGDIDGEAPGEASGYSVSLSSDGMILAVGAPNDCTGTGHVRVFKLNNEAWSQVGGDIVGEAAGDNFGMSSHISVALSSDGMILAVGAFFNDGGGIGIGSGHVRVFKWINEEWSLMGNDIDGEAAWDFSGWSVALSSDGSTVAIGAVNNDGNGERPSSGHTRVYQWNNEAWNRLGDDIDGEAAGDNSGFSVSLSSDGSTVAIGATNNVGSNGTLDWDGGMGMGMFSGAGHTRVYEWDNTAWIQLGNDIDGEADGDESGQSVALSGDGMILAVGAPYNDGNGFDSGHVRVYNLDRPTSAPTTGPPTTTSGGGGDPHFKTWKGEHFEYHGQCDMILTKDDTFANGLGLELQIRTKLVRFWSYIKSSAIRIGDDILEIEGSADPVLTKANNHYWINFEYQGELTTLGGFPVTYHLNGVSNSKRWMSSRYPRQKIASWFEIDLSSKYPGQKIVISTFREFVRVNFENGSDESFGNAVGMLGDFRTGKTLARDGVTELDDFIMLGNEWQVLPHEKMLFHDISKPQFPEKCIDPKHPRGERRRLGESSITEEQAEAACASIEDPLDRKDCVYDVLATQDIGMAGAY